METRRKARNESNPQKLAYDHLNAQDSFSLSFRHYSFRKRSLCDVLAPCFLWCNWCQYCNIERYDCVLNNAQQTLILPSYLFPTAIECNKTI